MFWLVSLTTPGADPKVSNLLSQQPGGPPVLVADDRIEALKQAGAMVPEHMKMWLTLDVHEVYNQEVK